MWLNSFSAWQQLLGYPQRSFRQATPDIRSSFLLAGVLGKSLPVDLLFPPLFCRFTVLVKSVIIVKVATIL
jgi:hypothetical protein